MEGLNVVSISCPRGQFPAPAYSDADSYSLQAACAAPELQQQPGSQLLEQLQECNGQAQRLLTLLSIHREQGIAAYTEGLARLFSEALACVVQALQTAAAAKQPLLTASSQHSSCFCKLLERLHLLDALWKASNPGPTPGAQAQQQQPGSGEIEPAVAQGAVQCPATPFITQLESKLCGTSGLDAVLAALIAHAQQNAATGSKLAPGALAPASSKQEVLEVSSLSAVQEHHSSARALPLLIRLYFNTGSRAETLAAGRPEPLAAKLLERALAVLSTKPVVPGCADVPVCLTSGLHACQGLSELAAARKLKLPTELGKLDFKAAFKLDQSYSLRDKVLPLLQQHDELCDLLSQLALEVQQAVAVERDIDPKVLGSAEQVVAGSISFAAAARNSLLDLDAWRLSTCCAGTDSATPTSARACQDQCPQGFLGEAGDADNNCDRYKLKDDDVVPFMDVLGAIKGLTGLLADSSAWLQPLLHEQAVKQLNEFAFFTLPALSKLYSRNPRLQDLLRAIYACLQGQFVEVGEDVDAALPSPAAEAALAVAASAAQQQTGQPLGEGFEGLKDRWGSLKGAARKHAHKQAAAAAARPAAALESPQGADAGSSSGEQQLALAQPSEAVGGCEAAIALSAAADLEAATAAAEAAAAYQSEASSPCSASQVEVAAAEQEQVPVAQEQDPLLAAAQTSRVSDSASADGTAASGQAAGASSAAVRAATGDEASAEPYSMPAESQAAVGAQQIAPGQASRKRTFKGMFKFKTSGRKRDKAAQAAAVAETAAAAAGAATSPPAAAAATAASSAAIGEQLTEPNTLLEVLEDSPLQPGSRPGSDKARRRQPAPPCLATAWTDSENEMPLCHIRAPEVSAPPSAASSMTDLNSAGFERPPDLPWELQGSAAVASDDSPRSVARAAAMFERIAAANRQLAGAPRLSSAGREVAGGSKSSPGGWDAQLVGTPPAARLTEVAGSPPSREELLAAAERDAEQHPEESSCDDSPVAGASMHQQDDGSAATPTKAAKKRQGLFGFRSLLLNRAAGEAPQGQQQSSGQDDAQALDAAEQKRVAAVQREKEQLAEQLHDKQGVALLSGQELDQGLEGCMMDDAAIPASWGPSPVSPKDEKHEGRMKGMLSMLRRGGARTASLGAAAALQGDTTISAVTAALTAEQQLSVAAAAAGADGLAAGADGIAAEADVAGSQCGSQPDASEDFDEDQPAKTRRVMRIMNRIRVFTQGAKEQQAQQPAMQQPQLPQQAGDPSGTRQGLKGLTFTAKLKKVMGDRRQSRFADTVGADGQTPLPLEAMPSATCLQLLRVLLELLLHEIKAETKKHLMSQLQMAAAAAAGSAGVSKPDASIARPLKQVKQMIKNVHRMQLLVDFPQQLLAAAELSDLWVGASCGSILAATAGSAAPQQAGAAGAGGSRAAWQSASSATKLQQLGQESVKASVDMSPPSPKGLHPWSLYNLLFEENSECSLNDGMRNSLGALSLSRAYRSPRNPDAAADSPRPQAAEAGGASIPASDSSSPAVQPISSFPSALIAACMQHLERMPCELPLLALQVLWDARRLLKGCGLLSDGLGLLQEQEKLCMCCYMQHLVPTAYDHFKRIAGHQTVTVELLHSCKAPPLQPVKQLYLDSLLREPCPLVMQANYAAIAAEATATLHTGKMAEADAQLAQTLGELADTQQALQQQKALKRVQQAVQELQQGEQDVQLAGDAQQGSFESQEERPVCDQLEPAAVRFSGVFAAAKQVTSKGAAAPTMAAGPNLGPTAGSGRASRKKRLGRASQQRMSGTGALAACAAASRNGAAVANISKGESPAGVTPLMQKLEALGAAHEVEAAAGRHNKRHCLEAWGACELDVRQWLLAGMLQSLQQDAELVVARCRDERPAAVVQSQLQAAILQRTHALMAQYIPLPLSWDQVWQQADAQQPPQDAAVDSSSCTAAVTVAGLLRMLDTAVYDAEAQVLLSVVLAAAADSTDDGLPHFDGVLAEVEAAVQPLQGFFGRQHLAALHAFTGPAGVQQLVAGVLDKLEHEQVVLLEELLSLQQQLPPSLLQMPPAEECHSAGAVLRFYQQQLSNALEDHAACAGALGSLQRIGNCLALLHLVSLQQAVQATPQFMQAAPLLGIVGRPMTDAAAAAECFEGEDLPAPPLAVASAAAAASGCHNLSKACTPGLLMPEVETLLPSDHIRHTYEMQALKELHQEDVCRWEARQAGLHLDSTLAKPGGELARHRVWQASHFQRLLLGPDAEKVRGPAMLLTQTAELRAWRATEGIDVLGPCLEKLQVWAVQLQQQLQGERPARRSNVARSKRPAAAGARTSRRRQHGSNQRQQVELSPRQQRVLSPAHATAAAGASAMSAEPSAESFGQLTDRTTDGELTEVEQQLHALQAQVNAALIAAEERLRVVSMSPPEALLTEVRPRMQLPPEPIPFSLMQDAADGSTVSVMQLQRSGLTSDHPAAALEAEDSVEQASPKDGTFSDEASCVAPDSNPSVATAASSDTSSPVPALLTETELAAAANAAAATEAGYPDPWEAADSGAVQQLTPVSGAPAQAKLGCKQLLTPAALSTAAHGGMAVLQHLDTIGKLRPSSERTGLAELVEEFSELSSQQQSQPDSRAGEAASGDDGLGHGKDEASFDDSAADCPSQLSSIRPVFVSCPGRCESVDGDATSASDAGTASQSPKSPWRATGSPSPARGAFDMQEGSYLMSQAAAQEDRWQGSPDSRQGSPVRYATPPMTELLYDTTVDELVRVKDERDMLMSEVEVLRNQLKNRDNTLAMLSGQMLITPRTSAADCESLMRAAMSECSIGSMAMRSQPAASGIPSQPSNTISLGASTTGTASMRRAASATPLASAEGSAASAAAARTPQPQGPDRQQLGTGRPQSAPRPLEPRSCETSAPVSSEPSKVSMRVQQTTPCADINTAEGAGSGAEQATCSSSDAGSDGSEDDAGSSSSGSYSDDSSDEEGVTSLDEACLISTAGCGASRKLKMPQTVKAARRSTSSTSSGGNPSPWPPAQLAVSLSALKFVLLLDAAMTEDTTAAGASQDGQDSAGGTQAQLSPLKRLKRAVEGVAAAAAAITKQQATEAAASKQRAAARGSGRMTTVRYGDGPLLATAVLLQLSGQSRRFEVLDASGRIAYWVEYDAVKSSSSSSADAAAGDAAGVVSPRGAGAASMAPSGVAAIVGAPGGIGAAAEGIAPPKPRSKKRQEEEAEALARDRAAAAAQQQLLERLAAAHRQAARITRDGSSLAARFAPAAPARSQKVRLRVFRVDGTVVQLMRSGGGGPLAGCASPGRITFGGGAFSAGTGSGEGSAEHPKVPAVPVRAATLQYLPRQQPWSCVRPTQRPIQTHPSLPMARPQPLLLATGPGGPARGGGVAEAGFVPPALAGLPHEAAVAAAAAAAAGTGIVGPSGRLLTGASVAPRAGLVAAARVMAAREVVLQTVPRNAAYSFSVVSDQNRSGRPEDGYSMAPSSADLDSVGSESPRRSPHRASFMSAAVGASAARLGGRQRADGSTNMEQWLAGGLPAGTAATEASSPTKAGLSRSPTKRTMSSQPSMLARAFGQ